MAREDFPEWYGEDARLLGDDEGMRRLAYDVDGTDGTIAFTDFAVFAGIHMGLMDVRASQGHSVTPLRHDVLEIVHCRRGRFECELARDTCVCVAEGDFAVTSTALIAERVRYSFPFNSFLGIAVVIDFAALTPETRQVLAALSIDLDRLHENLCLEERWFTGACTDSIGRVFSDLYEAVRTNDRCCFRLKVLELLFLVERFHAEEGRHGTYCSGSRARTVRLMRDRLVSGLGERISLEGLAREHGIGLTLFQNAFRDIYGLTPYAYLKHYKMHQAAARLTDGTESVAEIAQSLGYRNASKFAGAFKDVLGTTPREYRRMNTVLEQS
ncbi:MAG: AraC family transcriptional regulator [Coriobacteriales bacterium]|jgi:AraC-like DNA-binding protein|nr:AraC family transcriptional regulator [Coriobacteriales bacterium]